ncbi:MAG: hypothetical protein A6F71_04905 [Cycloclasticus sp. symbiont of Poecilosclerida sp. M]|nr:MAG: hypothetical protein A6F71_04905 [Cycloclasticus sp. symbiont of Poecilosclerida sp. M]
MRSSFSSGLLITFTLALSMGLDIFSWPDAIVKIMPNWTQLTFLYWCIALPNKVNAGTGWLTGLLVDVLTGSLLGHNALLFSLIALFGNKLYPQIRNYSTWQQAGFIFLLLLTLQLINFWIRTSFSQVELSYLFWLSTLVSALCWPTFFSTLRYFRRQYRIK